MVSDPVVAGHRVMFDVLVHSAVEPPCFLVETQFKCPTEPTDGILQYALQTKLDFYHHLATRPSLFYDFNLFMSYVMESREYWHQWYDIGERLLSEYNKAFGHLLIDLGGGKDHDLQAFYQKFAGKHEGVLVLQDLAPVLDSIAPLALHPSIRKVPQDFFTAQPEIFHRARVYLLHHILHNWNDSFCLRILAHLRAAMKPGYSNVKQETLHLSTMRHATHGRHARLLLQLHGLHLGDWIVSDALAGKLCPLCK
jgi:hypothetical protein